MAQQRYRLEARYLNSQLRPLLRPSQLRPLLSSKNMNKSHSSRRQRPSWATASPRRTAILWHGRNIPLQARTGKLFILLSTSPKGSYCSAPSSVLRRCQTARRRARKDCGHGPSLTVPPNLPTGTAKLSRFSNIERPRMLRVSDSAGPVSDWLYRAATRGAFPTVVRGRHPIGVISELNGWPTLALSTLHVQSHDRPRMTRGHNGKYKLPC